MIKMRKKEKNVNKLNTFKKYARKSAIIMNTHAIIAEIASPLSKGNREKNIFITDRSFFFHKICWTYFGIHLLFEHLKSVSLLHTGQFSGNSSLLSLCNSKKDHVYLLKTFDFLKSSLTQSSF